MQDEARIKALYCVLTGQPYTERASFLLDCRELWKSADILFRFFAPTDAQIGALLLYKFGGSQPEAVPDQATTKPEKEAPAPTQKKTGEDVPILQAGAIAWGVHIDGVPVKWLLSYTQGRLPVTRGGVFCFQDKLYRVSKIYATTLHLTSQESERYSMNGQEVIA